MTIGERIKREREKKNMTQKDLAEKLGKTKNTITEIEKGRTDHEGEEIEEPVEDEIPEAGSDQGGRTEPEQ